MKRLHPYTVYCIYSGVMMLLRYLNFTAGAFYYVTVVGLNPLQLVLVGTTLMTVILLSEAPTGVLADTYSRRLSVIIGTALIGAGFLLEGSIPHFAAVLAAQVIWGLGITCTSGALEAWIADELGGNNLDVVYLRGAQFGNAGAIVGIICSVALAGVAINLPIVVAGLMGLGLALFLVLYMPEQGFKRTAHDGQSSWQAARQTLRAGVGLVRGRPVLQVIMGVTFFFGMSRDSFDRLWEVHFLSQSGFPEIAALTPVFWFGVINIGGLLLTIVASEFVRRQLDGAGRRRMAPALALITALVMLGMFGFGLAQTFGLALAAYWSAYLMRRVYEPLYMAWINRHAETRVRATVISLSGQVDAIGQIAGGPLFGVLATTASTGAAIVAAGCALLPALLLYRLVPPAANVTEEDVAAPAFVEG